jgi:hypothetical protein
VSAIVHGKAIRGSVLAFPPFRGWGSLKDIARVFAVQKNARAMPAGESTHYQEKARTREHEVK